MPIEDKFNINLNQNLWGLVVAFTCLGLAEHFRLKWLFIFSSVVSVPMSISVVLAVGFYTAHYCLRKREAMRAIKCKKGAMGS
jgi:hypothetical protein